jgi:hypothetical protein
MAPPQGATRQFRISSPACAKHPSSLCHSSTVANHGDQAEQFLTIPEPTGLKVIDSLNNSNN